MENLERECKVAKLVSFAAVFRDVTQRSPERNCHYDFCTSGDYGTITRELLLVEPCLENFARDSSRK